MNENDDHSLKTLDGGVSGRRSVAVVIAAAATCHERFSTLKKTLEDKKDTKKFSRRMHCRSFGSDHEPTDLVERYQPPIARHDEKGTEAPSNSDNQFC